jgi:hypothetical protein
VGWDRSLLVPASVTLYTTNTHMEYLCTEKPMTICLSYDTFLPHNEM